ncbi:TPA: hypothetical protein ACRRX0_002393 [Morganella morganii]
MKVPKVITCTGYGGTGSSVISDLLGEFSNVSSMGNFEFRFIQDPNGIRDLDYGINENNNRLTTSYHINNFISYINYLSKSKVYNYESFFNNQFKSISDKFINNIVDIKWDGFWHQDIIDSSFFRKFIYYSERIIQKKILRMKEGGANFYGSLFNKKMYYSSGKNFHQHVKNYMAELILSSNHNNKDFVVFDQIIPSNNVDKYTNYFNEIKVIIVDRDPRDLYILNEALWKEKWIPSDNLDNYIEWFQILRKDKTENENIIYLQFEDFIYNYDSTIRTVCDFCNIDIANHQWKNKYFDPSISIKNTNLVERFPQFKDDANIIKNRLMQFCYHQY